MTDKEPMRILKEALEDMLFQMRFFNTEIKSINETLDKTLKLFNNFEKCPIVLQEALSK